MSSTTSKIEDADWMKYKPVISSLYSSLGLKELKERMASEHEFFPSEAQLRRQLNKWGLSKNQSKATWEYASRQYRKRKHDGKDSEIVINGTIIPEKKMKKEVSRYELPFYSVPSPEPVDGVIVRTPCAEDVVIPRAVHIMYDNLPNFKFQAFIKQQIELFYKGSKTGQHKRNIATSQRQWQPQRTDSEPRYCPENQQIHLSQVKLYQTQNAENLLSFFTNEAGQVLADAMNIPFSANYKSFTSQIHSRLDELMITNEAWNLTQNSRKLCIYSSSLTAFGDVTKYMVYLASNNLINNSLRSEKLLETYLQWAVEHGGSWIFDQFINLNISTTNAFKQQLFRPAVRLGYTVLVKYLIKDKIDIDFGFRYKNTALTEAISCGRFAIIEALLDAGVDPNYCGSLHRALEAKMDSCLRIKIIDLLIERGADVNLSPKRDRRPLIIAIEEGFEQVTMRLLAAGADVKHFSLRHGSAIQSATRSGSITTVRELLKNGAVLSAPRYSLTNKDTNLSLLLTPLQIASLSDNLAMVRTLLEAGAPPDQLVNNVSALELFYLEPSQYSLHLLLDHEEHDCSALQIAAGRGNNEIFRTLLNFSARVDLPAGTFCGRTALQFAAENGNIDMMKTLLNIGISPNEAPGYFLGLTAIQAAALGGHIEAFNLLIQAGADINAGPALIGGRTCLQAASLGGHLEMVERLLEMGVDMEAPAIFYGETAIEAAVSGDNALVVRKLLESGANPNKAYHPYKYSRAFFTALEERNSDIVHLLLLFGANVDVVYQGHSLLSIAMEYSNVELVRHFINAGLNINPSEYSKLLNLGISGFSLDDEITCMLLDAGADPNSASMESSYGTLLGLAVWNTCIEDDNLQPVIRLLSAGADANLVITHLDYVWHIVPPLCLAAETNNINAFLALLQANANVNYTSWNGISAIQAATRGDASLSIVEELVRRGADVNAPAGFPQICIDRSRYWFKDSGLTALQGATKRGDIMIMQFLLQHDADVNASPADFCGATALQHAAIGGNMRIVSLLLEEGADINAAPAKYQGRTALEAAAEHGRLDIVQLFLDNDHEVATLRERAEDAASLAMKEGYWAVAELLHEYCREGMDSTWSEENQKGYRDRVSREPPMSGSNYIMMIQDGIDFDYVDEERKLVRIRGN